MADSGMTFDGELAVFCEGEHVTELVSIIKETFIHHRTERLLRNMRETKFPHYKPSPISPKNTMVITSVFVVGCAILSLGAYYLHSGRKRPMHDLQKSQCSFGDKEV